MDKKQMPIGTLGSEVLNLLSFFMDVSQAGESRPISGSWGRPAFQQFWEGDMWFEWLLVSF